MTGMVADKTKSEGIVVEKSEIKLKILKEKAEKIKKNFLIIPKKKNKNENEKNKFIDSLFETQFQSEKLAVREKVDNLWLKF